MEKITEIKVIKKEGKIIIARYDDAYLPGISTSRPIKKELTKYEDVIEEFKKIKNEIRNKNDNRLTFQEQFTKEIRLSSNGISIVFENEELADEFLHSDSKTEEIHKSL